VRVAWRTTAVGLGATETDTHRQARSSVHEAICPRIDCSTARRGAPADACAQTGRGSGQSQVPEQGTKVPSSSSTPGWRATTMTSATSPPNSANPRRIPPERPRSREGAVGVPDQPVVRRERVLHGPSGDLLQLREPELRPGGTGPGEGRGRQLPSSGGESGSLAAGDEAHAFFRPAEVIADGNFSDGASVTAAEP